MELEIGQELANTIFWTATIVTGIIISGYALIVGVIANN